MKIHVVNNTHDKEDQNVLKSFSPLSINLLLCLMGFVPLFQLLELNRTTMRTSVGRRVVHF